MTRRLAFLILVLSLCSYFGMAQSQDYSRIARLSYLEGKVSFQHTDEVDWTAASINMALQPGDRIYTGDNGRAEIEFDDGSVLRLAEKTDIELLALKESLIQLKVLVGLCSLTGRSDVEFEINTPAAAFTTSDKGSYRFYIAENGDSDGIVRKGSLMAVNNRFSKRVSGGEVLHVPASDVAAEVLARYDQRDAWDEWNDRRNADENAVESRRYIADSVYYGVSDLDRYGRWVTVDDYGPAWVPMVDASWSPYWDGRWWYRPTWGWTWVSYEPWGWLPYHYGRWCYTGAYGWAWLPGPSFGFHFFSPGLVRFYRGANWISWCPLGPGDYYNVNNYYFNMRNRSNVYYLNELRLMQRRGPDDLVNRGGRGAFRTVNNDGFVNGGQAMRSDGRSIITDPRRAGRIVTDNLDVRPTARSFAPAPDRAIDHPNVRSRSVVVRTEPDIRSRGDRYTPITNPAISVPRSRSDQQSGGAASSQPGSSRSRITDQQQGGGFTGRTYQVPQSRSSNSTPATTQQRPTYRDTQVMPGQRQSTVDRGQQPPASGGNSRMNPTPPSTRSYGGSSGSIYSGGSSSSGGSMGGYSGGGSSQSSPSRSVDRGSATSSSGSGGSMSGRTGDGARTGGTSSGGSSSGSSTPVKKSPQRPMSSGYVAPAYQAPRQYASDRAVSAPAQNYGRPIAVSRSMERSQAASSYRSPSPANRESVRSVNVAPSYRSYSSAPAYREAGRTMNAAPSYGAMRSSAPQMSVSRSAPVMSGAGRSSPMVSGAGRSAPQRSSSSSAPPSRRR